MQIHDRLFSQSGGGIFLPTGAKHKHKKMNRRPPGPPGPQRTAVDVSNPEIKGIVVDYVRTVATRYGKAGIKYFELGNELNAHVKPTFSASMFAALAKVVLSLIHI